MPLPNSKQELADYILRRLGAPVINVEIADVQLEDCIDDAVQLYQEYHYDGAERTYRVIKIDSNFINRNKRRHQELGAEDFDSDKYSTYRLGARVMKKLDNVTGQRVYIKTDSDANHDGFSPQFATLHFPQHLNAVHVRHLHVERQQVGIQLLNLLECLHSILGRPDDRRARNLAQYIVDRLAVQGRGLLDEAHPGCVPRDRPGNCAHDEQIVGTLGMARCPGGAARCGARSA